MTILVTGGAGFIGSNFVLDWVLGAHAQQGEVVVNLDKLTYAGNLENLKPIEGHDAHTFVHGDIGDRALVRSLLEQYRPRAVINFAAESHVDRSIHGPEDFIETNVVGTFHLLEEVRAYFASLGDGDRSAFSSCTSRPMRSTDPWVRTNPPSRKKTSTSLIVLTLPPRRRPTTWCVPTTTPTACLS